MSVREGDGERVRLGAKCNEKGRSFRVFGLQGCECANVRKKALARALVCALVSVRRG